MQHSQTFRLGMDGVDAFGIVYFGRYWDWYEHTFEGLLAGAGHPLPAMLEEGVGLPVVRSEMDYRRALKLGEEVTATLTIAHVGTRSVRFQALFRDRAGDVTAEGVVVHAYTAVGMGPAEAPDWLRQLVAEPAPSPSHP